MLDRLNHVDLVDGRFSGTTRQDLSDLFTAAGASDHLVVHLHGGLVSRAAAHASGTELLNTVYAPAQAYPVFFVWNSDLQSVIAANLGEIANEGLFKRLVLRVVQFALGRLGDDDGGRGIGTIELDDLIDMPKDLHGLEAYATAREPGRAPATVPATLARRVMVDRDATLTVPGTARFEKELLADRVLAAEAKAIAAGVAPVALPAGAARSGDLAIAPRSSRLAERIKRELAAENATAGTRGVFTFLTIVRYAAEVLARVLGRYAAGRDHGLYTTVVEEVLRTVYFDDVALLAWTVMKRDTADAFNGDPAQHAGTAFVEELTRWWKPGRRVTIVAHSAGAVFAGNLVAEADRRLAGEAKLDVVLLAPACTFAFLDGHLDLFRRRVGHCRMFALGDDIERGYFEVPILYKGSLLYLVSGLCEDEPDMPLVGMQRYHALTGAYDQPAIRRVVDFLGAERVWSVAADGPGRATDAQKHGSLDDNDATRASLRHILEQGF